MYELGRGLKRGDVKESKNCKYLPRGFGFGLVDLELVICVLSSFILFEGKYNETQFKIICTVFVHSL